MIDVLVIFGPNLNMLGTREPQIYGSHTMANIMSSLEVEASKLGLEIAMMQSNDEGELVTTIQKARGTARAILFNLAAYTHTSVALRDAVAMFEGPRVEVHLSNNYQRRVLSPDQPDGSCQQRCHRWLWCGSFLLGLDAVNRLLGRNGDRDHKLARRDGGWKND